MSGPRLVEDEPAADPVRSAIAALPVEMRLAGAVALLEAALAEDPHCIDLDECKVLGELLKIPTVSQAVRREAEAIRRYGHVRAVTKQLFEAACEENMERRLLMLECLKPSLVDLLAPWEAGKD